jgi:RimJ/RimL family protein N-acetyltransferase
MIMIETSRLFLRPFLEEDKFDFIPALMDEDFMTFSPSGALNLQQAKVRFQELVDAYRTNGFGKIAIIVKETQQIIGYCGIEPCEIDGIPELELGYRLLKNSRGFGYATEAARALLSFEYQRDRNNIIAFTEPTNQPSINVLHKLGFKQYGTSIFNGMSVILFRLVE